MGYCFRDLLQDRDTLRCKGGGHSITNSRPTLQSLGAQSASGDILCVVGLAETPVSIYTSA